MKLCLKNKSKVPLVATLFLGVLDILDILDDWAILGHSTFTLSLGHMFLGPKA